MSAYVSKDIELLIVNDEGRYLSVGQLRRFVESLAGAKDKHEVYVEICGDKVRLVGKVAV